MLRGEKGGRGAGGGKDGGQGKHHGSDGRGSVGMPLSLLGDRRGLGGGRAPGKGKSGDKDGRVKGGKFEGGSGLWMRGRVLGAGPRGEMGRDSGLGHVEARFWRPLSIRISWSCSSQVRLGPWRLRI